MTTLVRFASQVVVCSVGWAICVQAQDGVKIVSRWSTNWDIGSSVTYIDGDYERSEGYWGERNVTEKSRMSDMSLQRCGDWSTSYLVQGTALYEEEQTSQPSPEVGKGLVHVQVEFLDTGERIPKFGSTARHIITTVRYDYSQSTCSGRETSHKYDVWYIDWPYSNKCSEALRMDFSPLGCEDRISVEQKGSQPSGFAISTQEEMEEKDGHKIFTSSVVKSLTHQTLDPASFVRPSNALPMSEFRKPQTKGQTQPAEDNQHSKD